MLLLALLLRQHEGPKPRHVEGHSGVLRREQRFQVVRGEDVAEAAARKQERPKPVALGFGLDGGTVQQGHDVVAWFGRLMTV